MKYLILLGDGMADEPLEELDGKTPLQHAHTPNMDAMAKQGRIGLAHTVPIGYHPGSDVANLSVFGYDPDSCYTGRSPLEAASMGVNLGPDDVAFRLNLVHLHPHYGRLYMEDFSAGHIATADAKVLIAALQEEYGGGEFDFHAGVSYRHLMVWHGGQDQLSFTPPHDITHQGIESYLPKGEGAERLIKLMSDAQILLHNHPRNRELQQNGKVTANSIWLWGHGRAPRMETLHSRFGLTGAVISAVDLIKGIGVYAGLDVIDVPGATGYLDTNYAGKAAAALAALQHRDFVYVHVEAPDEAAHGGKLEDKLQAIEDFDAKIVGPILAGLPALGPHRVLILPDHPTPVKRMTHTGDPVPFIMYGSQGEFPPQVQVTGYSEASAAASGVVVARGAQLLEILVG